ncbi:glycosyltransferase [Luteimonas sp. 9C]|uniref:glycosyltransferase n=1 Tax=Luteimonas sp. 9C TaxID=2653148 RepID=UPI00135A79F6|nr:glycosyltransferase [Luteimonas sp. 9C]
MAHDASTEAGTGAAPVRILVIDVSTPRPDRDSGSMRARRLMALMVELGYGVDFLPEDGVPGGHYADALAADGIHVVHVPGALQQARWLVEHAPRYAAVIVSRYHLAEAVFPLLRRIAPRSRLILDTVDLHHLREHREAERNADRHLLRLSAETRKRELAMVDAADTCWVVSPHEQALLARERPRALVRVVSNLHEPMTGAPGPERRAGILFVGGAAHPPNLDAVSWLLTDLFPAMRKILPALELHLAGEGLDRVVREPDPGVVVHGHVPDLTPLLQRVRLGVAPLRFGAGVKGKVNLGMSHGLPMVVTECAAEGLHLVDGEHALIADSSQAFVSAVAALCSDDAMWVRLSQAGQDLTRRHFTADAARDAVAASLPSPDPAI